MIGRVQTDRDSAQYVAIWRRAHRWTPVVYSTSTRQSSVHSINRNHTTYDIPSNVYCMLYSYRLRYTERTAHTEQKELRPVNYGPLVIVVSMSPSALSLQKQTVCNTYTLQGTVYYCTVYCSLYCTVICIVIRVYCMYRVYFRSTSI